MAVLNSWQLITRVLPGKPFGDGVDGVYSSTSIPTITRDSCSGSSSSTTLTTSSATFANGDVILIHQSRGTGIGQWEINRVSSGGGTTSLTLEKALQYTYTDSGASQAQAIKILRYTTVTVQSGTWTVPTWDGNKSGLFPFAASVSAIITGTTSASSAGYLGSAASIGNGQKSSGEGTVGASVVQQSANGNGGGGPTIVGQNGAGGGGGHVNAGTQGGSQGSSVGGAGGNGSVGTADLINLVFGGAGAGGARDVASSPTAGGNGAGGIMAFVSALTVTGGIVATGGDSAASPDAASGGAGAGGSILIVCKTATLGTNLVTALAGTPGSGAGATGGTASVGRIAVHHSGTITGTTNPTFTDVTDSSLIAIDTGGSAFFGAI